MTRRKCNINKNSPCFYVTNFINVEDAGAARRGGRQMGVAGLVCTGFCGGPLSMPLAVVQPCGVVRGYTHMSRAKLIIAKNMCF